MRRSDRRGGVAAEHAGQRPQQVVAAHRLVQVAAQARPGAFGIVGVGIGGTEHHQPGGGQRGPGLDAVRQLQAVHARHVHVQHGQLEGLPVLPGLLHGLQGLGPASDAVHLHAPALQLLAQDFAVGLVVVHHQHAPAGQFAARQRHPGRALRQLQQQVDDKGRACAGRALDADLPAHQPQQAPAYGQSQSGAAVLAGGGTIGLRKVIEDPLGGLGRDADASVLHADAHLGCAGGFFQQCHPHHDFAFGRELDGVAHQVGHHLPQPERVAAQHHGRVVRDELQGQLQSLGGRGLREHGQRFFHRVHQAEVGRFQRQVAGLDLREIQDVVDHAQQVAARGLHGFGPGALVRLQGTLDQQLVHAQHAVHGGADLVAHGGQKLRLRLVGFLGVFLGGAQFGRAALHRLLDVCAGRAFTLQGGAGGLQKRVDTVVEHADLVMLVQRGHDQPLGSARRDGVELPSQPHDGP